MQEHQAHLTKYTEMVEHTIDLDQLEHHQFVIRPDYDEILGQLSNDLQEVKCYPVRLG